MKKLRACQGEQQGGGQPPANRQRPTDKFGQLQRAEITERGLDLKEEKKSDGL